ncbi:hypothetical protein SD71_03630 [Cohnella kolymensis]|uniref:DUF2304 domain-containing protein n=1 Tax=Cohnella kolymensis TaxID=1590652 RepID=A0ABR5A9F0_9BACL|nr:DUF2304 domain-containing protein [Cohnella kolymensis]KIL37691.1 hypothetical protein SD71_03630 [Cohnella kolymensis]
MERVQVLSLCLSVALIVFVLHLIRRRALREQYALLWLFFGLVMLVLSIKTSWLEWMAEAVNVFYAPSLLFLVGIVLCFLLILHLTVVVSKLTERIIVLTQEIGLIRNELEKHGQEKNG